MSVYYNENDKKAAAWLRMLIQERVIPEGVVDERSIVDVKARELRGFTQCHFFAGIGGWAEALRLANWPADRPVWTGSCPCQPFSRAGKRLGEADDRHLWPEFRRLITECDPPIVFGEQVAGPDGYLWLSGVRADMENASRAFGAANLCAAGVSAPHVRERLYWLADADSQGWKSRDPATAAMGHRDTALSESRSIARLAHPNGYHEHWWSGPLQVGRNSIEGKIKRGGREYSVQWRIKPGLSIVVNGIPGRVEQLCGFGNAIVPQVAAEFVMSYMDLTIGRRG